MYLGNGIVGGCSSSNTLLFTDDGVLIKKCGFVCSKAIKIRDLVILSCANKIEIYKFNHEIVKSFEEQGIEFEDEIEGALELLMDKHMKLDSWCVSDDMLFMVGSGKGYYVLCIDFPVICPFASFNGVIAGVHKDKLYYLDNRTIKAVDTKGKLIEYQREILRNMNSPELLNAIAIKGVGEEYKGEAISFLESLNLHEVALNICDDESRKFELLLRLGRYDEAFSRANSVAKYKKLAKVYIKAEGYGKAADCYYKAGDWFNCYLMDCISEKRYVKEIADNCGSANLAFFCHYRLGNYKNCCELLEGSPFLNLFKKNYTK